MNAEVGKGVLEPRHVRADSEGYTPSALARVEGYAVLADWIEGEEAKIRGEDP